MSKVELIRQIQQGFGKSGLTVGADAVRGLISQLRAEKNPLSALDLIVKKVRERLAEKEADQLIVDRELVASVVADLSKNEEDVTSESLQVFDAKDIPLVRYNEHTRSFHYSEKPTDLNTARLTVFVDRLQLLKQRLMRDDSFAKQLISTDGSIQIAALDSLNGSSGKQFLFGLLTKMQDGNYYLEDSTGQVRLDFKNALCLHGFIVEGCALLVEGEISEDKTLLVDLVASPPVEKREKSIAAHPNISFLLSENEVQYHFSNKNDMESLEKSLDDFFLVLSEIHLDDLDTLTKLKKFMINAANDIIGPPRVIVLMGSFTSKPIGYSTGKSTVQQYVKSFERFAELLCDSEVCSLLKSTQFLIMPGDNDPTATKDLLPNSRILNACTKSFTRLILQKEPTAKVHFASNPTKILFYSQELVFFRKNIYSALKKMQVISPEDASKNSADRGALDISRTLLEQAHLFPLANCVSPTLNIAAQDSALRLYPLPSAVFISDEGINSEPITEHCPFGFVRSFTETSEYLRYTAATKNIERFKA